MEELAEMSTPELRALLEEIHVEIEDVLAEVTGHGPDEPALRSRPAA